VPPLIDTGLGLKLRFCAVTVAPALPLPPEELEDEEPPLSVDPQAATASAVAATAAEAARRRRDGLGIEVSSRGWVTTV
jgi:hypothetical protein